MTDVTLEKLTKSYPGADRPAVDDISIDIESGSLTALLGPSASGKSTVLKMIAGLLSPSAGDILFDGRSVLREPPDKRDAVLVFQEHLLFPYMTVAENIGFGLKMRRRRKDEISSAVGGMMELMQLDGLAARKPNQLSGGQQQRVALARALVLRPKLLLLDEPFSSLDANLRVEMQGLLRTLHAEFDTTMLFVTHDQEEAVALADSIALLLDGKLRQYDTPDGFYARPRDRSVATFFGAKNFIEGRRQAGIFDCAFGQIRLPDNAPASGRILTFRPENVKLVSEAGGTNSFPAIIESIQFLGSQTRLQLTSSEVRFEALVSPFAAASLQSGQQVMVQLPAEVLWLVP